MKYLDYNVLLIFVLPLTVICQDNPEISPEILTKSVIYLKGQRPKTEYVNNQLYELGLRAKGETNFRLYTETITGTGFFIKKETKLFLVTASHVAKSLLYNDSLITADSNGNSVKYLLNMKSKWKHSDSADVAISEIQNTNQLYSIFYKRSFDYKYLPPKLTAPVPELPLIVIGFPLNLGVKKKFSPLRRETNAASNLIDLPRADTGDTTTFFIIQDPSIAGYSGAPVFVIKAFKFGNTIMKGMNSDMCIGVIHGTYSDNTGGKLGMVTPAKYINDLIK